MRAATLGGMTTTTRTCTARRTGRALTVVAGAAGALLLWAVDVRWAGIDLVVRQGDTVRQIGPAAVLLTALAAGLAAWGLLALLERTTRHAARTFRIVALLVLLVSLAGPLGSGTGAGRWALLAMHTTVGAALIVGLPGRRTC